MKDVPERVAGKIVSVTESGTTIQLPDGEIESVDTEAWRLTHGEPQIGAEVERVFQLKKNTFGTRFYGYVPKGFQADGWN